MTTLVFIFVGIAIGAALVGAYLIGRERGRIKAIDDVARNLGRRVLGGGQRRSTQRAEAEMAVVGETESNADGTSRQSIIAMLALGEDVELVRESHNAKEVNVVRVISSRGEIGKLAQADAELIAPYLDSGGRVSATIALVTGSRDKSDQNVVLKVIALEA